MVFVRHFCVREVFRSGDICGLDVFRRCGQVQPSVFALCHDCEHDPSVPVSRELRVKVVIADGRLAGRTDEFSLADLWGFCWSAGSLYGVGDRFVVSVLVNVRDNPRLPALFC